LADGESPAGIHCPTYFISWKATATWSNKQSFNQNHINPPSPYKWNDVLKYVLLKIPVSNIIFCTILTVYVNTTGNTCGPRTAYPSGAHGIILHELSTLPEHLRSSSTNCLPFRSTWDHPGF